MPNVVKDGLPIDPVDNDAERAILDAITTVRLKLFQKASSPVMMMINVDWFLQKLELLRESITDQNGERSMINGF